MKKKVKNFLNLIIIVLIISNIIIVAFQNYKANEKDANMTGSINDDLEIHFIDVGQADCTLIRVNNKYVLIDAGNRLDGKKLVEYFKSKNINTFEYVIATHPHEDHIGGMKNIIDNFNIINFYMADVTSTYKSYTNMIASLKNKNIEYKTFNLLDKFNVDEAVFTCLSNITEGYKDSNDTSLTFKMEFHNTKYLFMSDATNRVENKMLKYNLRSDVLKVSHHGSKYSSGSSFITKVAPRYAIISVGKDNEYHLPHQKALNRFNNRGIKVYRTDELGTIVLKSDGEYIKITNYNTDTNGGDMENK